MFYSSTGNFDCIQTSTISPRVPYSANDHENTAFHERHASMDNWDHIAQCKRILSNSNRSSQTLDFDTVYNSAFKYDDVDHKNVHSHLR